MKYRIRDYEDSDIDDIVELSLLAWHPVFQMLADIGDDMFAVGGAEGISKSIISAMEHGSKVTKDSKFSPIAIKEIGIQALTRWGLPVPTPFVAPVLHCHV